MYIRNYNYMIAYSYIVAILLHIIGFKYQRPPPLPSNHVNRQSLLDEIATKLLQATNDPNKYETTLTITGAGGFGKTTTVILLCHNPHVKEQFNDGFVFIELGPQATDPSIKLSQLYHLLTGEYLKQCDINHAEQEINQLTSDYYRNLLVIIDDVWHVEDAEPLVKAFSNCKTILTTRMNVIEQYIPSKQSVTIGPMMEEEAISLLTSGVIDSSQLSQEVVSLLNEISQDVHLWPLLLSLIRGQLSHNLKQHHLPYHKAIQNVQAKLHHKGLTAFDKNNIETVKKGRKLAVKACIDITLELLTKSSTDKIKTLILWNGIGISLQTAVLNNLWNISKQEAEDTVDVLWAYGLVQFTDITISPNNIKQHCVQVHAVISQCIIECMDSKEANNLYSIMGQNVNSVAEGLILTFQQSYEVHDPSSLTAMDYLKYKLSEMENVVLPHNLKRINMYTVFDPHDVILILQQIKDVLMTSPYTINLLSLLGEEINSLTTNSKQILKDVHKLCRKLNQSVQRNLYDKNYDKLIQTVEEFIKNYPLCNVAQKAVTMVKKIIPCCDGELLHYMMMKCEHLQMMTHDYHEITTSLLPLIKLFIKLHKQITSSLLNGSPDIELTYHYIMSGKYDEEMELLSTNYLIKLQEVAPNFVQQHASQQ